MIPMRNSKEIARFLVSVSPDIPWHVTGFHPDYKMTDPDPTSVKTLRALLQLAMRRDCTLCMQVTCRGALARLKTRIVPPAIYFS